MSVSKLGRTLAAAALVLAAAPALATETLPLDDAALSQVTALGIGDLAMLTWLPEPTNRSAFLPAMEVGAGSTPAAGLVRGIARSDQSTVSLDPHSGASRILQTAIIDLPASQAAVGVVMQSTRYQSGGQSATNLAVAATLNGMGTFGSIRP